jgi:hypothetical protein
MPEPWHTAMVTRRLPCMCPDAASGSGLMGTLCNNTNNCVRQHAGPHWCRRYRCGRKRAPTLARTRLLRDARRMAVAERLRRLDDRLFERRPPVRSWTQLPFRARVWMGLGFGIIPQGGVWLGSGLASGFTPFAYLGGSLLAMGFIFLGLGIVLTRTAGRVRRD